MNQNFEIAEALLWILGGSLFSLFPSMFENSHNKKGCFFLSPLKKISEFLADLLWLFRRS